MAKKKKTAPLNPLDALVARLNTWPRVLRIVLNTLVALLITGLAGSALFQLMGLQAGDNATPLILITMAFGIALYAVGWSLMVGFDWNLDTPWQARRAAIYYMIAGLVALLVTILLIVGTLIYNEIAPV